MAEKEENPGAVNNNVARPNNTSVGLAMFFRRAEAVGLGREAVASALDFLAGLVGLEEARRLLSGLGVEPGEPGGRPFREVAAEVERAHGSTPLEAYRYGVLKERELAALSGRSPPPLSEEGYIFFILEKRDGEPIRYVEARPEGVAEVYRRYTRDGALTVRYRYILPGVVLLASEVVRLVGVNIHNIMYRVDVAMNGRVFSYIGTPEDIVYMLNRLAAPGSQRVIGHFLSLVREGAAEYGRRVYYAPGPWVDGGRLVLTREAGYLPPWKPNVRWEPPVKPAEPGRLADGLAAIKHIVESYGDPAAAAAVLSYAAIAPFALFLKERLGFFPHLIIQGLQASGKTLLLDLVRALYNIPEPDSLPKTDFQVRRLLAASTLPALVDEIGSLVRGYQLGGKGAHDVWEALHRSASQVEMRSSGGHGYGGTFLAVRAAIMATNASVELVGWQLDKFLVVELSRAQGVDPRAVKGFTPRTAPCQLREAFKVVGAYLLEAAFEEALRLAEEGAPDREALKRVIIEAGYRAWERLYHLVGLKTFPKPGFDELQAGDAEEEDLTAALLDFIHNYRFGEATGLPRAVTDDEKVAGLETWGGFFVEEAGRVTVYATGALLRRFLQYARREYGLATLVTVRRLVELLGGTRTSISVAGKRYNVYTISIGVGGGEDNVMDARAATIHLLEKHGSVNISVLEGELRRLGVENPDAVIRELEEEGMVLREGEVVRWLG